MIFRNFKNAIIVILGLTCVCGYCDELTDLVTRLQKIETNDPIRAAVHIEQQTPGTPDNTGSRKLEKLDLLLASDADTLTLSIHGDISHAGISEEFSLLRAVELLHYGPTLARELTGLKRVQKLTEPYQEIPCTRWLLRSEETRSQFGMSASLEQEVQLWIDKDGYPVAASFKKKGESKMLLFRQSRQSTREQHFKRFGNRLILIFDKQEDIIKQSKSKDGKRIVTTTVKVKKSLP